MKLLLALCIIAVSGGLALLRAWQSRPRAFERSLFLQEERLQHSLIKSKARRSVIEELLARNLSDNGRDHSPAIRALEADLARLKTEHARLLNMLEVVVWPRKVRHVSGRHGKGAWLGLPQISPVGRAPRQWPGFPRVWVLLGFLLGKRIRKQVYEPYQQELLEDYTRAKKYRRSSWARRWLGLCFTIRTLGVLVECIRVALLSKTGRFLLKLIPGPVRHWWQMNGP